MSKEPQEEWADKAYAAIQDDNDNRPTLDILREHFNAALAAMHTQGWDDAIRSCGKQLAAERENWKVAVGNLATIARENAEQLAAEREKAKNWEAVALSNKRIAENCMNARAKAKGAK
jgi:hypothetical protein